MNFLFLSLLEKIQTFDKYISCNFCILYIRAYVNETNVKTQRALMNVKNTQCADCRGLNNNNNNNNNLNNTRFIQELDNIMSYNIGYGLSIPHFIRKNI
jgi:hypothetical protein